MIEDGVYFGLPEEEYFEANALGYSDLKLLARSPADWWWQSPHNPLRKPPQDSDGKRFGSALHCAILMGMEAYAAAYFVRPDAPPDAIKTVDEIKAALDERGADYKKSANKDVLIETLRAAAPDAVIYDQWIEEQRQSQGDRQEISADWDRAIRMMHEIVRQHPDLKRAFSGGEPEVSVFWTRDDVQMRARFDYLKPQGVMDLKSIANWRAKDFRSACIDDMRRYSYGMQGAHYCDARLEAARLIGEGRVFGAPRVENLPALVAQATAFEFVFVFMQTIGSPRALPVRFPQEGIIHGDMVHRIETALDRYRTFRDAFGFEMWVETDPLWKPSDDELAPLMWSL